MRDSIRDRERDLKIELGKPFRKYIGCRCRVVTPFIGQEGRLFYRTGQVVNVTYDDLYLDCDGLLRTISIKEIIEIKEVDWSEGR